MKKFWVVGKRLRDDILVFDVPIERHETLLDAVHSAENTAAMFEHMDYTYVVYEAIGEVNGVPPENRQPSAECSPIEGNDDVGVRGEQD